MSDYSHKRAALDELRNILAEGFGPFAREDMHTILEGDLYGKVFKTPEQNTKSALTANAKIFLLITGLNAPASALAKIKKHFRAFVDFFKAVDVYDDTLDITSARRVLSFGSGHGRSEPSPLFQSLIDLTPKESALRFGIVEAGLVTEKELNLFINLGLEGVYKIAQMQEALARSKDQAGKFSAAKDLFDRQQGTSGILTHRALADENIKVSFIHLCLFAYMLCDDIPRITENQVENFSVDTLKAMFPVIWDTRFVLQAKNDAEDFILDLTTAYSNGIPSPNLVAANAATRGVSMQELIDRLSGLPPGYYSLHDLDPLTNGAITATFDEIKERTKRIPPHLQKLYDWLTGVTFAHQYPINVNRDKIPLPGIFGSWITDPKDPAAKHAYLHLDGMDEEKRKQALRSLRRHAAYVGMSDREIDICHIGGSVFLRAPAPVISRIHGRNAPFYPSYILEAERRTEATRPGTGSPRVAVSSALTAECE